MKITAGTLTNGTLTLILDDGAQILTARNDHPKWNEIMEAFKSDNANRLISLISLKSVIEDYTIGMLSINGTGVTYAGKPIHTIDAERVMAFLRDGLPYKPIANYIERKMANPSSRAINEMYNFLEHKNMPLTDKGTFIAYKGVSDDFYSMTGNAETIVLQGTVNSEYKILNTIGSTIEVQRSAVDDDFRKGCSYGLHAGSLPYAARWGTKVVLVEIDPADVVSIPYDCNFQKLRCCKYKVVGEYTGPLPDHYINEFSDDDTQDNSYDDDDDDDDDGDVNDNDVNDNDVNGDDGNVDEVDDTCDCNECNPKTESESMPIASYEGCNDYNPQHVKKEECSGLVGKKVKCECHIKHEEFISQKSKLLQTKEAIENKIRELYSKHFKVSVSSISPDTTILYLGVNMNEWIEFCNAVEEEFSITIPKPLTLLLSKFERFVSYVRGRILATNDMNYIKYCLTEFRKYRDKQSVSKMEKNVIEICKKLYDSFMDQPICKDIAIIISDVIGKDKSKITAMVTGKELEMDDVDVTELCFCLEDRYDVHIPNEMSEDMLTLPFYDIVARISVLIKEKQIDKSSDDPYVVGKLLGVSDFVRGVSANFLSGDENATDSEDHCRFIKGYLEGYNL